MEKTEIRQIRILKEDHVLKPFDCGIPDLNDFFINDAKKYQKQRLAISYFEEQDDTTVFFFSLRNDRISATDTTKTKWNKISRNLPNDKRTRKGSYPAVKIGRLGVNNKIQSKGIGTEVMDIIKNLIGLNNYPTGARYLTVDAYNNNRSLNYYKKNGFEFLTEEDEEKDTRAMYFDLKRLDVQKEV